MASQYDASFLRVFVFEYSTHHMRNFNLALLFCSVSIMASAQYSTPIAGVAWTLDSLVLYSGGVVTGSGSSFAIHEELEISVTDSLFIFNEIQVNVDAGVQIRISGFMETGGDIGPNIRSTNDQDVYEGFRVEEGAVAIFRNTIFPDGGGFKLISGEVFFEGCEISNQENISTNSAAIECFTGGPVINNCTISFCDGSAISSPANIDCWPSIIGNFISGNNTLNSNRPQINLGPSGSSNAILIQFNTIIGNPFLEQAGGIAVANLLGGTSNAWIQGNVIDQNRYGIAILGNGITALISDNIITNNAIQNDPILGGSGINLNGNNTSSAVVAFNLIAGNLWGITVQGDFQLDMGNPDILADSPGNNEFSNNGNNGDVYALYNNTPSPILAVNNCWITGQESTASQVENVIFHATDDGSLGLVDYSPFQCGIPSEINEETAHKLHVYPNPVTDFLTIEMTDQHSWRSAQLLSMTGNRISLETSEVRSGRIDLSLLAKGMYILELDSEAGIYRTTIVKD